MQPAIIGIVTVSGGPPDLPLFEWMTSLFPVRFQGVRPGGWDGLDAAIFLGLEPSCPGLPSLQIPGQAKADTAGSFATVRFGEAAAVPGVFRGRVVDQENLAPDASLNLRAGDQILATLNEQPVWAAREDGGCRTDLSAMALPRMDKTSAFFNCFAAPNFARLLPVVDFLRRLTGDTEWSSPGLRACFMFDDPNLHSTSYGWMRYQELLRQACRHNYHAAIATIPLDAWFANGAAAGLFREYRERLSLLIHGNNHLHKELAGFSSEDDRLRSLAQAWNRISRLEAKTAVKVSRVMAAPHGACSEETLRAMGRLGFEAACISHGSLHGYNSGKSWAKRVGLRMSEFVAGLPVVPRLVLSRKCQNSILAAAYLDKPVIPFGHHQDVAGGLGLLADLANFINSLGQVRWMDMKGIARSNYQTRTEGSLLRVRSFARIVNLTVPPGVTQVSIHRPKLDEAVEEGICLRLPGRADRVFPHYAGEPFPVPPGADLEVASFQQNQIDPNTVPEPKARIWPFARRILTEGRDRLSPFAGRLAGKVPRHDGQKV